MLACNNRNMIAVFYQGDSAEVISSVFVAVLPRRTLAKTFREIECGDWMQNKEMQLFCVLELYFSCYYFNMLIHREQ